MRPSHQQPVNYKAFQKKTPVSAYTRPMLTACYIASTRERHSATSESSTEHRAQSTRSGYSAFPLHDNVRYTQIKRKWKPERKEKLHARDRDQGIR